MTALLGAYGHPSPTLIDLREPTQRAAAADAVAGRLHMSFGVCRDRAQVMARELLDAAHTAAAAAQTVPQEGKTR